MTLYPSLHSHQPFEYDENGYPIWHCGWCSRNSKDSPGLKFNALNCEWCQKQACMDCDNLAQLMIVNDEFVACRNCVNKHKLNVQKKI